MRVTSWNMGCGYGHAYASMHDDAWRYLLAITDVALVQEAVPPDWLAADDYVFVPKYSDQSWGTAVVARGLCPRRVQTGEEQHWLPKLPGAAVIADVDIDGSPIRFVSMHPRAEATDEGFTGEADLAGIKPPYHSRVFPVDLVHSDLKSLLRDRSFVVAGDLNSALRFDFVRGRNSEVFGNADLFQKFRDHGWRDGHLKFHAGEERTFFRGDQNYMLDHLYVDDALYAALRSCDVIAYDEVKKYSDHAPLTAVIDL